MERYKVRPGIAKLTICGQPVLAPTREASRYCQVLRPLSLLWAATWEAFESEKPIADVIRFHQILTKKSESEIEEAITRFCEELTQKGFMIRESDREKDADDTISEAPEP